MSEETKKTAQELEECDLDAVAGGGTKDIQGIDIVIVREPRGKASILTSPPKTTQPVKPRSGPVG